MKSVIKEVLRGYFEKNGNFTSSSFYREKNTLETMRNGDFWIGSF